MGQKVNPNGLRLGVNKTWKSTWYAKKDYATKLNNDLKLRDFLAGYLNTGDFKEALRLGTASGSATAFSVGIGSRKIIDELLTQL